MTQFRFLAPAATLLAILACSPADAGWWHRHHASSGGSSGYVAYHASSGGSSGYASYGSSGGSSGYASYGSSGGSYGSSGHHRVGLFARLHAHIAAKRARFASHGSSGYTSHGSSGYTSHGSSGYSSYGSSGYVSSYSSHGSSGHVAYHAPSASSGASYSYSAPVVTYSEPVIYGGYESGAVHSQPYIEGSATEGDLNGNAVEADQPVADEAASASARVQADAALITVSVPASAKVTVNGHPTTSEGPIRQFMSRGLKAGYTYTYEVVVESTVDGQMETDIQTVRVRAGGAERLVFKAPESKGLETALTVHVPGDAKVTLAGNQTIAKGPTRVFRTRQLNAGESWSNYEVQVTVIRDGREISKRKTLSLVAGSQRELNFDFDGEVANASLASR